MISQATEFIVDGWVMEDSGQFTVVGRCGDEPIRIGDTFDAVFRYKHRRYPDEMGLNPVREVVRPATLIVRRIESYQRTLDTLGQGMTGTLVLVGDGMEHVHPGWVLGIYESSHNLGTNGFHDPI